MLVGTLVCCQCERTAVFFPSILKSARMRRRMEMISPLRDFLPMDYSRVECKFGCRRPTRLHGLDLSGDR